MHKEITPNKLPIVFNTGNWYNLYRLYLLYPKFHFKWAGMYSQVQQVMSNNKIRANKQKLTLLIDTQ